MLAQSRLGDFRGAVNQETLSQREEYGVLVVHREDFDRVPLGHGVLEIFHSFVIRHITELTNQRFPKRRKSAASKTGLMLLMAHS